MSVRFHLARPPGGCPVLSLEVEQTELALHSRLGRRPVSRPLPQLRIYPAREANS